MVEYPPHGETGLVRAITTEQGELMTEATAVVEALDLSLYEQLVDKKVKMKYRMDDETVDAEGTLVAVSVTQGVMFRKRGSQTPLLLPAGNVLAIEPIAESPKKVTSKKLRAVTLDDARAHLADRHGYTLTSVNGATAEQGLLAHQQIDHSDLGHTHEDAANVVAGVAPPATETPTAE